MWTLYLFVPVITTLAYKLYSLRSDEAESRWYKPRVTDIRIYPIKSCRGISLTTGKITQLGFEYDRAWMVVDDSSHRFLSQRQVGSLATILTSFKGDSLCVDAPGMNTLKVPLATTKSTILTVTIWDDTVTAIDEGNEAAEWFSKYLNKKVRLVKVDPKGKRIADPTYWTQDIPGPKLVSFADGYPFLMFSKESLEYLNNNITSGKAIDSTRFRANIIVEGVKTPFDEDLWSTFSIRDITFHAVKPCGRCKITTMDQDTGEVAGPEPLATLQRLRKYKEDAIFGQNVVHESAGYICVGDVVKVEARSS